MEIHNSQPLAQRRSALIDTGVDLKRRERPYSGTMGK